MAQVFLSTTDASYNVGNNNDTIFGESGTQILTIGAGVTGTTVSSSNEGVRLNGAFSSFTYLGQGANLLVFQNGVLVATIALQNDADGTRITTTDGTVSAFVNASGTTLGGATVPDTKTNPNQQSAGVVPVAAQIDTTNKTPVVGPVPPAAPTFSVAAGAASVTEGGNATFIVSLSAAQGSATTVNYTLAGTGTPAASVLGTDTGAATVSGGTVSAQTATSGTITFAAGVTSATISVPVTFDTVTETGKGLSLTLSGAAGATGITQSATAATLLTPDVPAPTFTLTSNVVAGTPTQEGTNITFTITPSGTVDKDTVLTVNLTGQTVGAITSQANAADFTAAQTVTFRAGDNAPKTTLINVVSDGITEGIEGYRASLLDNTFTERAFTTGTITDPTATYVLTGATSVNEGSSVTYTVTSSLPAPVGGTTIPYTLSGNATLTTDYTGSAAATGTIIIAAGATTGTLILNAVADNLTEPTPENVIVTLGTPSSGNVTTGSVTTVIADTSQGLAAGSVSLSSSATAVNEGSVVTYTVTLGTAAPAGGLTVPYTLSGTSTLTADYTGSAAATGNITVAAGATTGTLVLTTVADFVTEGAETIVVTLGTLPAGYTLVAGQGVATTTINDTSLTVAGQTFTLTTNIDTFTGTAGNDTFQGLEASLGSLDTINGSDGTDTLSLALTSATNTLTAAQVSSIETLSINQTGTASTGTGVTVGATGITSVTNNASTVALIVSGLASLATVNVLNTAAATTVIFAEATAAGSADIVNVTVSGVTAAAVVNINTATVTTTVAGALETINVASNGSTANSITLDTNDTQGLGAVNISGAAAITVALGANAATDAIVINAGAATGRVTVTGIGAGNNFAGTAVGHTITGGSANDSFALGANYIGAEATVASGTRDVINGGDGTDTLSITIARVVAASTTAQANLTSIEALTISDAWTNGNDINVTRFADVRTVTLAAATAGTSTMTLNSGTAVTLAGDSAANSVTSFTVAGTGVTDTMTLNLASFDFAGTGTETFTGIETLNINTGATIIDAAIFNDALTLAPSAGVTNGNIVVTGANAMTFIGVVTAGSIDASALTGILTVTATAANGITIRGGTAADVISGSAVADLIVGGLGADVITSNAGNDSIDLTEATASVDRVVFSGGATNAATLAANGMDTITGFGATDTINVALLGNGATTATGLTTVATAGAQAAYTDGAVIILNVAGTAGALTTGGTAVVSDFTNMTQVAAFLSERYTHTTTTADLEAVVVWNVGTTTYVYNVDSLNTANTTIDAAEISLVGTITQGAALVAANIVYA